MNMSPFGMTLPSTITRNLNICQSPPWQSPQTYSSYHLYPIRINESQAKKTQRQTYDALRKSGIAANLHYIPVHRQPYYENLGFKAGDFPEAEQFHREIISLPIYPNLGEAQNIVTTNLFKIFNKELPRHEQIV